MSELNKFAKKLDDVVRRSMSSYRVAIDDEERAKDEASRFPVRQGISTAEYEMQRLEAEKKLVEASENVRKEKENLEKVRREVDEIRAELTEAINEKFGVNPSDVDQNTISILQSGIMNPEDYLILVKENIKNGNYTMARIVGESARKYIDVLKAQGVTPEEQSMRTVKVAVIECERLANGRNHLEAFDTMVSVFDGCIKNPALYKEWGELTRATIETF